MSLKSRLPQIIEELPIAVRAAELAGAKLVEHLAKERVAYDESKPAGKPHLRDVIHTEETEEGVYVVAGDNKIWYGVVLEHGSVKMAPRPFLVPALEESRAEIEATVAAALRRTVG